MRRRFRYDRMTGRVVEVTPDQQGSPGTGPFLWQDSDGYLSPVTGKWIEGRAARRDDLSRHGCVDAREFDWGRRE